MTDQGQIRAGWRLPVGDLIAAAACLAGSTAFLVLALALPEGHSTGDVGPAALPRQIGIFGIICSAAYLLTTLRGALADQRPDFSASHRAFAAFATFAVCLVAVRWVGLPLAISAAGALVTLLFAGERRLIRALATGVGVWLVAVLLFQKLLGLPMP